jgi:hypothetical protein
MRTWLVLAVVLAVGAAAVADTLRGSVGGEARSATSSPTETAVRRIVPPGVPNGFMGSVVYSDPADECRLHALRLAGFRDVASPDYRGCRFSLSPDGTAAAPRGSAWSPLGGVVAVPGRQGFVLRSASGQEVDVRGESPAFKPDGTLTYVHDGRLVEWTIDCARGARLFTIPGDNGTARCLRTVYPHGLASVAWLTSSRFAAISAGDEFLLVDNERVVVRAGLPPHGTAAVAVSPQRRFVNIWLDGRLGGTLTSRGAPVVLPPVGHVRAFAWSPTERWALLATQGGSVYLFRPGTGDARLRRLDVTARDLAWR